MALIRKFGGYVKMGMNINHWFSTEPSMAKAVHTVQGKKYRLKITYWLVTLKLQNYGRQKTK